MWYLTYRYSMKKILTLVLVLVLLGPTVLLACDCCSTGQPQSSSTIPGFSAVCDCCNVPQMEQNRQNSTFENSFVSEWIHQVLSFFVPSKISPVAQNSLNTESLTASPPFGSPLYLSLQVLRI